jgi:hypothetical protein
MNARSNVEPEWKMWRCVDEASMAYYRRNSAIRLTKEMRKNRKTRFGATGPKPRLKLRTSKMWVTQKLLEAEFYS